MNSLSSMFAGVLMVLLFPAAILAVDCADYRAIPQIIADPVGIGETPRLFATSESALCWAVDSTLVWCPLLPAGPDLAGTMRYTVHGGIAGIRMDGDCVAVVTASGGWEVASFTELTGPTLEGRISGGVGCLDVDISGSWVYAAEQSGMAVYQLQPAGPPLEFHREQISWSPWCLTSRTISLDVEGDRCWVLTECDNGTGTNSFVGVLDVSNPAAPAQVGSVGVSGCSGSGCTTWNMIHAGTGAAVLAGQWYVSGDYPSDSASGCVAVLLAEIPGDVSEAARKWDDRIISAGIAGDNAYFLTTAVAFGYSRAGGIWREVDILGNGGDMLAATPDGAWIVRGQAIQQIRADRTGWPHLAISYRPLEYGSVMECRAGHIFLMESNGYSGEWPVPVDEVAVLDAADPLRVVRRGSVARAVQGASLSWAVGGDFVYTNRGIWNWRSRSLAGAWSGAILGIVGESLWMRGNLGLDTFDLSDPATPVLAGSYLLGESVLRVVTSGNRAVAVASGKLIVIDATSPLLPVKLSELFCWTFDITDVALDGDRLLVARDGGLTSYRLAADGTLTPLGALAGLEIRGLATDQAIAYAATSSSLAIIDLADPAQPTVVGEFPASGYPHDVQVDGEIVYLNDGQLRAFRRQCPLSVGLELRDFTTSWRDGAPCIAWTMNGDFADLRLLANGVGRQWVVPWSAEGNRFVAVDWAAPSDSIVEYTLQYRVEAQWTDLVTEAVSVPQSVTRLHEARPNPFNPRTELDFTLGAADHVELTVHDLSGRRLRTLAAGEYAPGTYTANWDGTSDDGRAVGAGGYIARLRTAKAIRQVKLLLLK